MIRVYHFRGGPVFAGSRVLALPQLARCDLVADVETDDLEVAYARTNHLDNPWPENDGVHAHMTRVRSTSVGDLLVDDRGIWVVAPFGFEPLAVIETRWEAQPHARPCYCAICMGIGAGAADR